MSSDAFGHVPLIKLKNEVDFSIISPTDEFNDGAFCLVIPVNAEDSLPAEAIYEGEVELSVLLHDKTRSLRWRGVDGTNYRVNLDRVDIDDILKGNEIKEVDIFCVILSALNGETLGIGEVFIRGDFLE